DGFVMQYDEARNDWYGYFFRNSGPRPRYPVWRQVSAPPSNRRLPGSRPGAGFRQEGNFIPQPGPLSKEPMPTITLGKHKVSRLWLGVNGIGTHYSNPLSRFFRQWNTPEELMR